jgi:hypothetical protein
MSAIDEAMQQQDPDGSWHPAVPLPTQGLVFKLCPSCHGRFLRQAAYERHFRLCHCARWQIPLRRP